MTLLRKLACIQVGMLLSGLVYAQVESARRVPTGEVFLPAPEGCSGP